MKLLQVLADGRACLDVIGDDMLDVFRPTPGRDVFVKLTIARVRKWWLEQPAPPTRSAPDATVSWSSPHTCGLLCEDGALCLFTAETEQALR
eukprot:8246236-Pyramimonas_sp.AAC.1